MDYVKEEDGWIFAECPECHMIMKFRKNELQRLSIRYKLYESVECFCGRDDEWIYGVPMEQTATNNSCIFYTCKECSSLSYLRLRECN